MREGSDVRFGASAGLDRLRFTLNGQEGFVADSDSIAVDTTTTTPSEGADRSSLHESKGKDNMRKDGSCSSGFNGSVFLGEMDLARLNDGPHHHAHAHAVAQALAAKGMEVRMPPRLPPSSSPPPAAVAAAAPSSAQVAAPSSSPPPAFILDLCGAWGMAGLLVAQLERCCPGDGTPATRVLAVAENEEAAAVLNAIARENDLGPDRYVATADGLVDLASRGRVVEAEAQQAGSVSVGRNSSSHHVAASGDNPASLASDRRSFEGELRDGNAWPSHGSGLGWAVVMASSLVEGSGLLKQGGLGDLELCRQIVSAGSDNSNSRRSGSGGGHGCATSFVPGHLEVVCQGLQRVSLLSENRVLSERCCGVDVDPVSAFSVASFRELDLSAATTPCCSSGSGSSAAAAAGGGAGNSNNSSAGANRGAKVGGGDEEDQEEAFLTAAVACYDLDLAGLRAGPDGCFERRLASLRVERAGTLHAIAYWYRQSLGPGSAGSAVVLVDTKPVASASASAAAIATACSDHRGDYPSPSSPLSHFRQAAVLLQEPIAVTVGQCIDICVLCHTSRGVIVNVLGVTDGAGEEEVGDEMMCSS